MTTRSRIFNGLTYKTAGSFTNMTIDEQDAKLKEFKEKGYSWRATQTVITMDEGKAIVTEFWTRINDGKY